MSSADKPDEPTAAPADVKDKFREALERKRGKQRDRGADANDGDSSKVHGEHGPAHVQRTFRRKSGG
jgi:Family of unknown function (DUF5302)